MNNKKLTPAYIARTVESVSVLLGRVERLRETIVDHFDIEDDDLLDLEDEAARDDAGLPVDERRAQIARIIGELGVSAAALETIIERFDNE